MPVPKSWVRRLLVAALSLALAGLLAGHAWNPAHAGEPPPAKGRAVVRPVTQREGADLSLEGGSGWINSAPIRLEDLRGKIVLLDFWTYCCINCHHMLPTLAKLEEKYRNELVVIGVHTPKFYAERDLENVRRKVREYHIKHPVINDANQAVWDRFGVESWPTLVVLGPKGEPLAKQGGEVSFDTLDRVIGKYIREHKAQLNETPVKFFPEIEKPDDTPLLFPGKVLADAAGKRLFIADTAHCRIVIADLNGKRAHAVGTGEEGLEDGPYNKAKFNRPQGMCLVEDTLYVADTENHTLRAIDLKAREVSTVAGTGKQTHVRDPRGLGLKTALTSPWDVVQVPGTPTLMVAMAGQHQIWRYNIESGTIGVWAGFAGREDVIDGPVHSAAFAQPSGLATDGKTLFVADSEGSAIRAIDLKENVVRTIAGTHDLAGGRSLFAFGDTDGVGDESRLQHCLGVAYGNGQLYIADTYNCKIKVCALKSDEVKTLAGKAPGDSDDPPRFYQPGGLSLAGSTLYIADTNNHAIRALDLKSKAVRTLELEGLAPPTPPRPAPTFKNALVINVDPVQAAPGQSVTLGVTLPLPDKAELNKEAPMPYLLETPGQEGVLASEVSTSGSKVAPPSPKFSIKVPLAHPAQAGDTIQMKLSVAAFVCNKGSNLCQVKNFVWNVPITFAQGGKDEVTLSAPEPAR